MKDQNKTEEGNAPVMKGLVLAGGKSTRMGVDKGGIVYHDKPQREYAADLLSGFCEEVYISSRTLNQFTSSYPLIPDIEKDLGPFGGIMSAFHHDPEASWLIIACDLPLLDSKVISKLIDAHDSSREATCYANPETGYPEPLISIWEPRIYPKLLESMSQGNGCPRKMLINGDVKQIELESLKSISNVNTPDELKRIKSTLK